MASFRDALGRFAKVRAPRVQVYDSIGRRIKGDKRRRIIRREAKRRPLPPPPPEPEEIEEVEGVPDVTPATFPKGYDTPFRKFITPVRYAGASRQLYYVLVELADTSYKTESGKNLIVPLRLGQFTRKEIKSMSRDDVEETASAWHQWEQVTFVHGVYARR